MLQFQSPPVQITRSLKAKWQDQAGFQDSRSEMSQTSRTSVQAKWQWFMILPNDVLDLDTELFPRLGLVKKWSTAGAAVNRLQTDGSQSIPNIHTSGQKNLGKKHEKKPHTKA